MIGCRVGLAMLGQSDLPWIYRVRLIIAQRMIVHWYDCQQS